MSSSFSSVSASLLARQIARVSRPRPWAAPAHVVKPAPACSTSVAPSPPSRLTKPAAAGRTIVRVCRSQGPSAGSSSKDPVVGGRSAPTLAGRAAARESRDRPWINPRAQAITNRVKATEARSKTARWIRSQAVDIPLPLGQFREELRRATRDASPTVPAPRIVIKKRRPVPRPAPAVGSRPVPAPAMDRSMVIPAPRIVIRKRRPAPPAPPRKPSSSLARSQQQVVPPASADNSIAALVREEMAFDINEFRDSVAAITDKIASHRKWLRRQQQRSVRFDDRPPTVIPHPRWIDKKEHVYQAPSKILGYLLGWRRTDESDPYGFTLVWGSGCASSFDHSDCENPSCHRRGKDLYMQEYEEWTPPVFSTMSE